MRRSVLFVIILNYFHIYHVYATNLPGPLVYVVTPSSKPPQVDMGRAVPFYYSNWIKRMDTPSSTTTATITEKTKTPDLIFAEFESDNNNMKSIRKLLEKEKIYHSTTTTTSLPIYVPEEDTVNEPNNGMLQSSTEEPKKYDMTDYFAVYNNLYNTGPVYVPNTASTNVPLPSLISTDATSTTTEVPINNVENIWHIIDNEKHDQYSSNWEQIPINSEQTKNHVTVENHVEDKSNENQTEDEDGIDDNFALPGFGTNPGNGGENESRAIRTESNIRFPYVNLKPFMMKNLKTKKGNNMFNLDSFTEIKHPVRGEVQDNFMVPVRQPVDRYNPAQPYLPDYGVGTKTKQPSVRPAPVAPAPPPRPPPVRTVANLVPPPPPPPPKLTSDDFPTPSTYESFPPYAPSGPGASPIFSFPSSDSDSFNSNDDGPPISPVNYKPPSGNTPSAPSFIPTIPPLNKPLPGYSYNKPPMTQEDSPPTMDAADKPDFQGYHYSKPISGFSYNKPMMHADSPPAMDTKDKPDFQGYHYSKPAPAFEPPSDDNHHHPAPTYGHHDAPPPSYHPEADYPDLIFDKPHGMGDMKGGDDMKGNDMGMMPPPPPPANDKPESYGPPADDHGFPHDFPGDLKYSHDFDDHDYHHHHHHPTTTTTTTEMPRVNRYSYYYLGKKLYYLPLYFSVYFVIYVGALIIKAVLRHKITYPNSYRPNDQTATFFSKRSIESHLTNDNLHEMTGRVTKAIATAAEKYVNDKTKAE